MFFGSELPFPPIPAQLSTPALRLGGRSNAFPAQRRREDPRHVSRPRRPPRHAPCCPTAPPFIALPAPVLRAVHTRLSVSRNSSRQQKRDKCQHTYPAWVPSQPTVPVWALPASQPEREPREARDLVCSAPLRLQCPAHCSRSGWF